MKQLQTIDTIEKIVSRETIAKLRKYQQLLFKWNKAINLISKSTEDDSWNRHFIDSLQLIPLINNPDKHFLVDIGSGAGFPGMVLAVTGLLKNISLIEIDQRKSIFLKEVARETSTKVEIIDGDYKKLMPPATLVTARGINKIQPICKDIRELVAPSCTLFFLKGENYADELKTLDPNTFTLYPSITSVNSKIIKIGLNR